MSSSFDAYDDNGNISSITRGTTSVTYQYNGANELVRENNGFTNQTVTYAYDLWGNITEKNVYAYTTVEEPTDPIDTKIYGYSTGEWKDQLLTFGAETIGYDAMGNPLTYRGKKLSWHGKQLTTVKAGDDTVIAAYVYDSNGLRQKKTVSGTDTNYYYNGSVLIGLTKGDDTLRFSYDASGQVSMVEYEKPNETAQYYYLRNGQGDIVKLIDATGASVVEYTYDSLGKKLSCTGTLATDLGVLNPFRYRGYVYDEETQWYYLKSRYYDPETCRFISADVLLSTGQGVLGNNAFAYCLNSPTNRKDQSGHTAALNFFTSCVPSDKDDDNNQGNEDEYTSFVFIIINEQGAVKKDIIDLFEEYLLAAYSTQKKKQGLSKEPWFRNRYVPDGIEISFQGIRQDDDIMLYYKLYGAEGLAKAVAVAAKRHYFKQTGREYIRSSSSKKLYEEILTYLKEYSIDEWGIMSLSSDYGQ